jgi:predicted nuclease of restriction endonuclease-like (RecB) superfamily
LSNSGLTVSGGFPILLGEIKNRIQQARTRALLSVNAELVHLYWDIGRIIAGRQEQEGWGAAVIPRLARELKNELPEEKGFSQRNLDRMIAFYRSYSDPAAISPPVVAKLETSAKTPPPVAKSAGLAASPPATNAPGNLLWSVPWAHHVVLMEKVKDHDVRLWYMAQTLANGWSRNVLMAMIQSGAHARQGQAVSNFERLLPLPQSDLVRQTLKDPYIFDFLTLEEPFHERELETTLLHQLERFLLELGQGFAFVGRQYYLKVGDREFYIDLLFYHLTLRCFVVIDLKKGEFKPEYAGKMNFYLSVVDDQVRHAADAPSIGLILCQDRNHIVAEYALRGVEKPIGISEYELTRALPASLKSALPTVEEIEAELAATETPPLTDRVEPEVTRGKKPALTKPAMRTGKKQSRSGRGT